MKQELEWTDQIESKARQSETALPMYDIYTASEDRYFKFTELLYRSLLLADIEFRLSVIDAGLSDPEGKVAPFEHMRICPPTPYHNFDMVDKSKNAFLERPLISQISAKENLADYCMWLDSDFIVTNPLFFLYLERNHQLDFHDKEEPNFFGAFECSSSYLFSPNYASSKNWMLGLMIKYADSTLGLSSLMYGILNSGVLYGKNTSPIWKTWQDFTEVAVIGKGYEFGLDQVGANFAVMKHFDKFIPISPVFNWMINYSVPHDFLGDWVTKHYPYKRILGLHMATPLGKKFFSKAQDYIKDKEKVHAEKRN